MQKKKKKWFRSSSSSIFRFFDSFHGFNMKLSSPIRLFLSFYNSVRFFGWSLGKNCCGVAEAQKKCKRWITKIVENDDELRFDEACICISHIFDFNTTNVDRRKKIPMLDRVRANETAEKNKYKKEKWTLHSFNL